MMVEQMRPIQNPKSWATPPMMKFITSLAGEREWIGYVSDTTATVVECATQGWRNRVSFQEAREAINALKSRPYKMKAAPAAHASDTFKNLSHIPVARYAVYRPDTQVTYFFQVTENRVTGRKFINRLIGAPGAYRRERISPNDLAGVVRAIAQDPPAYAAAYARVHQVCARCHSPLTDPVSRGRGLGPDCVKYFQ